jgi:hypothetical protein
MSLPFGRALTDLRRNGTDYRVVVIEEYLQEKS